MRWKRSEAGSDGYRTDIERIYSSRTSTTLMELGMKLERG